jgi:hypothetical protein
MYRLGVRERPDQERRDPGATEFHTAGRPTPQPPPHTRGRPAACPPGRAGRTHSRSATEAGRRSPVLVLGLRRHVSVAPRGGRRRYHSQSPKPQLPRYYRPLGRSGRMVALPTERLLGRSHEAPAARPPQQYPGRPGGLFGPDVRPHAALGGSVRLVGT